VDGLSGGREAIALARQLVSETGRLVFANVYRGALAGRGLHQLAADEHADLLVVGSSHRSAVGRLLLGDDTQAALNGAPCAVAIAPRGYALGGGAWTTIGVGDDGSAEAALAREAACVLAERHHATVRLRSVVGQQRVPAYEDEPPEWTTATVEALERERQRWGRSRVSSGMSSMGTRPRSWRGSPPRSTC
jgi:nucleotide-binding universal stress UspA family protein